MSPQNQADPEIQNGHTGEFVTILDFDALS
jgi:hypothetical protein